MAGICQSPGALCNWGCPAGMAGAHMAVGQGNPGLCTRVPGRTSGGHGSGWFQDTVHKGYPGRAPGAKAAVVRSSQRALNRGCLASPLVPKW